MPSLHNHLIGRIRPYAVWHQKESHHIIHWSVFSFGLLALFFIITGSVINFESEILQLSFLERFIPQVRAAAPTSGLAGFWKFEEGSGNIATDGSGSGLNCILTNPNRTTGKIGQAIDFNGINSDADCGQGLNNLSDFTLSAWIDPDSFGEQGIGSIINKSFSNSGRWSLSLYSTNNTFQFLLPNSGGAAKIFVAPANSISASEGWIHIAVSISDCASLSTCNVQLYKNGQAVTTTITNNPSVSTRADDSGRNIHIGTNAGSPVTFDGLIDEVRIYTRALSSSEISNIYSDTNSGSGSTPPSDWYSAYWPYRKVITTDSSKVSGSTSLTDFPLLISISDAALRSVSSGGKVTNSNGADLLFVDAAGNKLDHEIEKYVSTTGELVAWVRIPSLLASIDTQLFVYYGNASPASQANAAGVWGNTYSGVWHLSEGDSTARGFYADSKSVNHGTLTDANGNTSATTGKIGIGLDFAGDADYVETSGYRAILGSSPRTVSGWFNTSGSGNQPLISWGSDNGSNTGAGFNLKLENGIFWGRFFNGVILSGGSGLNNGSWRHFAYTYPSGGRNDAAKVYIDGNPIALTFGLGSTVLNTSATLDFNIGRTNRNSTPDFFNGNIDEVRISSIDRSADWIKTEFNNQNNPATFYSIGAEEESGVPTPTPGSDTTPPTVAITSPATGTTVTGTVNVIAVATDNVGVSGVQFKLDGNNLGLEDSSSPYSVSWNTVSVSNGLHTLSAIARDGAGNMTTSSMVNVTVNNATVQGPAISNVNIDLITKTTARVYWETSVPATTRINYGETTLYGRTTEHLTTLVSKHSWYVSGLKPGSLQHICPQSRDAASVFSLCDGGNNDYTFTTLPDSNNGLPEETILPLKTVDTTLPSQTGTVLNVHATNCDDISTGLQARINEASSGSGPYTIVVPAGLVCTDTYDLKSRPASENSWIVIRTSTPDSQLPSPGTRITPFQSNLMPKIRSNVVGSGRGAKNGRFGLCQSASDLGKLYSDQLDPSRSPRMEILYRCISNSPEVWEPVPYTTGTVIPTTCNPGEMFYKTDAKLDTVNNQLLDQMYMCVGPNEFAHVDYRNDWIGGRDGAINAESGAHHYRLIGLELTQIPHTTNSHPAFLGNFNHRNPGGISGFVVNANKGSHHIVIDRSYLHGLDYPDRTWGGISLAAEDFALIDSRLDRIMAWGAGSTGIGFATTAHTVKIQNNHIDALGITFFADGPFDAQGLYMQDIEIKNNYFTKDLKYYQNPDNPERDTHYKNTNWGYMDIKHGRRINIDGNVFERNWGTLQSGPAITILPRTGSGQFRTSINSSTDYGVSDVAITNNVFRDMNYPIQIVGHEISDGTDGSRIMTATVARTTISNNLFYNIDGYLWQQDPANCCVGSQGIIFGTWQGMEDIIYTHNTVYNNRGVAPRFLNVGGVNSGLLMKDNLFWYNLNGGINGAALTEGTVTLNGTFTKGNATGWTMNNNIVVRGSGVNANVSANYPTNNTWLGSEAEAGFMNSAAKNFELQSSSPYKNAASDGTDLGVNWAQLQAEVTIAETGVSGGGTPSPSGDVTAPSVVLTSPGSGTTVSGTVTISANATDNVGIVGVQFRLDGSNQGLEDASTPYSVLWDTSSATNGNHELTAVARDAAGNTTVSSAVTVTVNNIVDTIAPILSSTVVSNISQTSATITWVTNEAASSQVQYGLTTSYGSQSALDSSLVTNHSVTLSGLSAGTTYNYRVRSKDAANNEAVGINRTFTTGAAPDLVPPAAVANLTSSNVTQTSARLSWTAPGDDGSSGTAAAYDIRYTTAALTNDMQFNNANQATGEPNPSAAGTSQSYTLVGLSPNTTYRVALKTSDESGNISALSNVVVFTTSATPAPGDTTPPSLGTILANLVTQSGATISWTTNESATSQVEYGLTASYGGQTVLDSSLVISHTVALSGLAADTIYHYRVISTDADGNTAQSSDQTFTTAAVPDTNAPAVSNLSISNIADSTATITWATSKPASSVVEFGLVTTLGFETAEANVATRVTDHSVTLSNLVACSQYRYRVRSRDTSNNLGFGVQGTFYTKGCIGDAEIFESISKLINVGNSDTAALTVNGKTALSFATPSGFAANLQQAFLHARRLNPDKVLSILGKPSGRDVAPSHVYAFTMFKTPTSTLTSFNKSVTVTMGYDEDEINGLNPNTLSIYRNTGTSWQQLSGCSRDTNLKQVTCTTTGFSIFVLAGTPDGSGQTPGSGGGSGGGGLDTTPPPSVTDANVEGADGQIALAWKNPVSSDYIRTVVVKSATSTPETIADGQVIYEGIDEGFVDVDVQNGQTYYYTIFTLDRVPNYSVAVSLAASPIAGKEQTDILAPTENQNPTSFGIFRLVKYASSPTVYLIENGMKRAIPSLAVLYNRFGNLPVITISDAEAYPDGEALLFGPGALLKTADNPAVWLIIDDNSRYGFKSAEEFFRFGYRFDLVQTVSQAEFDSYPVSGILTLRYHAHGNFIKYADNPTVYRIEYNTKKAIPTPAVFFAYSNSWGQVLVSASDITYQDNTDLTFPEGYLIKGADSTVYLIENNQRKAFRTADAFLGRGYSFNQIIIVSDPDLNLNALGEEID